MPNGNSKFLAKTLKKRVWALGIFGGLVVLLSLASCSTVSYCAQATGGHIDVLRKGKRITRLLDDEETDVDLVSKLRHVQRVLAFAREEMQLDPEACYTRYADLERSSVVWNVYAAPEFSLKPKTWWYPVVGSLSYRGYFDEEKAKSLAEKLRAKGFDVLVGGVEAYSTLGWFNDPVLNTFIDRSELGLVTLLCHELAHRRLFFASDTELSEAFATTIEEEALARWIAKQDLPQEQLANFRSKMEVLGAIKDDMEAVQDELEFLYDQVDQLGADEVRRRKALALDKLQASNLDRIRPLSKKAAKSYAKLPMNNARLATSQVYHGLVPELQELLHRQCGSDLKKFYRAVKSLGAERKRSRNRQTLKD